MNATITENTTQTYSSIRCYRCALTFYVPVEFLNQRHSDGQSFWCPIGHEQHFSESTLTKLHKTQVELSANKTQLQLEKDQRAAAEAALQKQKRRISCGVCPVCRRNFQSLSRHMKTKHPTFSS